MSEKTINNLSDPPSPNDHRLPTTDYRLPTTDYRPKTNDQRLTTKDHLKIMSYE